jgi:transcriptional regulator with XRE-family HTH domain
LTTAADINQRLAERVRDLRAGRGLSLDMLATKSGVSRSMISLIERGESSPTAVLLDKLAVGLGVTLAALFEPSPGVQRGPVARRSDQSEWRDPASGYLRRNVSPSWVPQPMQIVEVRFPPKARVAFETSDPRTCQQIWLLDGAIEVTRGTDCHLLESGDCLAMQLDRPAIFYNPTAKVSRYAVVIAAHGAGR